MLHDVERNEIMSNCHSSSSGVAHPYNSSPKTTLTNATMVPASRLIWIMLAPLVADLLVEEDVDAVVDEVVPFCCFAAAWKAAKLLGPDSTAFTLKTMPEPQWLPCERSWVSLGDMNGMWARTNLSAIRPNGSSVLNGNIERREFGGTICDRHEAGIKSNLAAGRCQC